MAGKELKIMISSTVVDLPKYREAAMAACLERDIHPKMMEHMTALNAAAIKASLDLVDQADVYLGIFAHRYGYIPKEDNPQKISITEMEYNRAVEFDTPRLIFLIKENYPFDPSYVDKGKEAAKLKKLKKRLGKERVVKIFTSPEDLRGHIVSALAALEEVIGTDATLNKTGTVGIREIPKPPKKYIAHPYTLLQTHHLVGRKAELDLLNDWVSNPDSDVYKDHILSFVAIGGLGKSALTWKWFDEIAPNVIEPRAGRIWWSFYDREAYFENFVLHALAYVSDSRVEDMRKIPAPERETKLLAILNREPFLVVLDGFERELIAYARGDASRLEDSEVESHGNLRKTTNPRVGQFLKKLAQIERSRILISTRLQPAELETDAGKPSPGVFRYNLESLPDDDAVALWQALGVEGSRDILLPVFRTFGKHTLSIQTLSGEIVNYRKGPGNFNEWRKANPQFNPAKYTKLKDRMAHVLEFVLNGLRDKTRNVLNTIAAFRMPTAYGTLAALLVGEGNPCTDVDDLDGVLTELEDRGLVGWERQANQYDLHPIVRRVVWNSVDGETKNGVYTKIHAHFEALPKIEQWEEVRSLADLTPALEMYNALIGMGRYDDAEILFYDRLDKAMQYRLLASQQRLEMLELLFPDGLDSLPPLSEQHMQVYTISALCSAYQFIGQPMQTVSLYRRHNINLSSDNDENDSIGLINFSIALRMTGELRDSEESARRSLEISHDSHDPYRGAVCLYLLGLTLLTKGNLKESGLAFLRSIRISVSQRDYQVAGSAIISLAKRAIWLGKYAEALKLADRAWELAYSLNLERDFICSAQVKGEAAMELEDYLQADERLYHALTRVRAVNLVEEELSTLNTLAELRRRQGDEKVAREFLDDVWEYAERGPYPILHADARNVLAQIERDAGNREEAIKAATQAYELSWCDGPPYAYHWGLIKAQKHLEELGAPLPVMKPFNEADYEPMPEVEIDPEDEFHVGTELSAEKDSKSGKKGKKRTK
jgi:tetratricopeptide (TPR) repeat protein